MPEKDTIYLRTINKVRSDFRMQNLRWERTWLIDLDEHFVTESGELLNETPKRILELEDFFAQTKADIRCGERPVYDIYDDYIEIPNIERFRTADDYYLVLAHELIHWTKNPKRLNRDFTRDSDWLTAYSKEEIVAQFGACFLSAILGVKHVPGINDSALIQSWMDFKECEEFIFSATSYAQKASDYILNLQKPHSPS